VPYFQWFISSRWVFSGMLRRVVWYKFTDVSEVLFCLHHQGVYQTTLCNIPEDIHLHTRRRENLESRRFICYLYTIILSYILVRKLEYMLAQFSMYLFVDQCAYRLVPTSWNKTKYLFITGNLTQTAKLQMILHKWTFCSNELWSILSRALPVLWGPPPPPPGR
jgi:hypothetical protein